MCLLSCEHIGQEFQQVLRTTTLLAIHGTFCHLYLSTKEVHLAPEVVLEAPSDEVLQRLVPLAAVCHIEHHGFQVGYHIGTEGKVFVHTAL